MKEEKELQQFPLLNEFVQEIAKQEVLDLINQMPVVYYDTDSTKDGDIIYIATVEDNENNRNIIKKLGFADDDIKNFESSRDNEIDLTHFVWGFVNWFDGEKFSID